MYRETSSIFGLFQRELSRFEPALAAPRELNLNKITRCGGLKEGGCRRGHKSIFEVVCVTIRLLACFACIWLGCDLFAFEEKLLVQGIEVMHSIRTGYEDLFQADDNSCWRLHPVIKKAPSLREWWNGEETQQDFPNEFYFEGAICKVGDLLNVYLAEPPPFPDFPHVLENQTSGQKIFARLLSPRELLIPTKEMIANVKKYPIRFDDPIHRVLPYLGGGIFVQSDQSIWRVDRLKKGIQTWSEWWNGIELEQSPNEFDFYLEEWKSGQTLNVYEYSWDHDGLAARYSLKFNGKVYLVENIQTGHLTFAFRIDMDELINFHIKYAEERYNDGYRLGYDEGYQSGKRAASQ